MRFSNRRPFWRGIGRTILILVSALVLLAPSMSAFAVYASAEEKESAAESAVCAETEGAADTEELGVKEKFAISLCKLVSDALLFDLDNKDPARVSAAYYFAGYKGQVLFFGDWSNGRSGSFGRLLGLHAHDKNIKDLFLLEELLKHEHGHYEQYQLIGFLKYVFAIAIPSIMNMPADYYSQPWEVTADLLGGVTIHRHAPGSEEAGRRYLNNVISSGVLEVIFGLIKG